MLGYENAKDLDCGRAALRVAIHEYLGSMMPENAPINEERFVISWHCRKCGMSGSAEAGTEKQAIHILRLEHAKNSQGKCRPMERASQTKRYSTTQ